MRGESTIFEHLIMCLDGACFRQVTNNVLTSQFQELAIEVQPIAIRRLRQVFPIEARSVKR